MEELLKEWEELYDSTDDSTEYGRGYRDALERARDDLEAWIA
jgi:hypothetical protein